MPNQKSEGRAPCPTGEGFADAARGDDHEARRCAAGAGARSARGGGAGPDLDRPVGPQGPVPVGAVIPGPPPGTPVGPATPYAAPLGVPVGLPAAHETAPVPGRP